MNGFNTTGMDWQERIFGIRSESDFEDAARTLFLEQVRLNPVYRAYAGARGVNPESVRSIRDIPFLPVGFFKSHEVLCAGKIAALTFRSSGTTGMTVSRHPVADPGLYRNSLLRGFERMYGSPSEYAFLALAPGPAEAPGSSLVFMIRTLMESAPAGKHGFFLGRHHELAACLQELDTKAGKGILIGLAYALLDFAESHPGKYDSLTVIETGGMKGRRRELIREELHERLQTAMGVKKIHSEYGMTELLSQCWSRGEGRFSAPPWMRVLIRDPQDPLGFASPGETGGISVTDLANRDSCAFIATEDLGRALPGGEFEVLGRFDAAEARGCSLMM